MCNRYLSETVRDLTQHKDLFCFLFVSKIQMYFIQVATARTSPPPFEPPFNRFQLQIFLVAMFSPELGHVFVNCLFTIRRQSFPKNSIEMIDQWPNLLTSRKVKYLLSNFQKPDLRSYFRNISPDANKFTPEETLETIHKGMFKHYVIMWQVWKKLSPLYLKWGFFPHKILTRRGVSFDDTIL